MKLEDNAGSAYHTFFSCSSPSRHVSVSRPHDGTLDKKNTVKVVLGSVIGARYTEVFEVFDIPEMSNVLLGASSPWHARGL